MPSFGFLADAGSGASRSRMVFFAMAFALTPVLFLWTQDLTLLLVVAGDQRRSSRLGQYSWMPVWLPELFPTRHARDRAWHSRSTRRASSRSSGRSSPVS